MDKEYWKLKKREQRARAKKREDEEKEELKKDAACPPHLLEEVVEDYGHNADGSLKLVNFRCQKCNRAWGASLFTLRVCPYCKVRGEQELVVHLGGDSEIKG